MAAVVTTTPQRDAIVKAAQSWPAMVARLEQAEPDVAESLKTKTLATTKSAPVTAIAGLIALVATYYGLGWPPDFCGLVGTLVVLAAGYVMRAFTGTRIAGLFKPPAPSSPAGIAPAIVQPPAG